MGPRSRPARGGDGACPASGCLPGGREGRTRGKARALAARLAWPHERLNYAALFPHVVLPTVADGGGVGLGRTKKEDLRFERGVGESCCLSS